MAKFVINKPIKTAEPVIVVDALPLGSHVFRLVVVDQSGHSSEPDELVVTVLKLPILDPAPASRRGRKARAEK
jgi:hypothetical protein